MDATIIVLLTINALLAVTTSTYFFLEATGNLDKIRAWRRKRRENKKKD